MITIAATFIVIMGLLIFVSCMRGVLQPQWMFDFAAPLLEQGWMIYLAVGVRLALGIALLLVAEGSAFPLFFTILGWFTIAAALVLPLIGMTRIKALVAWIETLPTLLVRLWMAVGLALGALLLIGVRPLF